MITRKRKLTSFLDDNRRESTTTDENNCTPVLKLLETLQGDNSDVSDSNSKLAHADIARMRKCDLYVPVSVVDEMESLSEAAKSFAMAIMESSLDIFLNTPSTEKADKNEKAIRSVMKDVENEMATAVGPVKFRRKNYAELKYSIIKEQKKLKEKKQ